MFVIIGADVLNVTKVILRSIILNESMIEGNKMKWKKGR